MRALIAVLALAALACARVDVTEHCVMTRYGRVVQDRMENGLHWMPIADATCFPLTEQNFPAEQGKAYTIDAQTSEPVTVAGDMAIVYAYDPRTVYEVFTEKRSQAAAEVEIVNSIREGYRNAVAAWTIAAIFSERRAALADSVKSHIQRKIGDRAQIRQVFIRDIRVPEAIENARIRAAQQAQVLDQARKQFTIDSVNAMGVVVKARAEAEARRLEAQAYSVHPRVLDLKIAEAFAGICKGVTTCVVGGSVADVWMGGPK